MGSFESAKDTKDGRRRSFRVSESEEKAQRYVVGVRSMYCRFVYQKNGTLWEETDRSQGELQVKREPFGRLGSEKYSNYYKCLSSEHQIFGP